MQTIGFILFTLIVFGAGFLVGQKNGTKALADLQSAKDSLEKQVAAWKEAAQTAVDQIKSKF